jgi:hypothetical protein
MGAVGEIFREFAPEYLHRFSDTMPPGHRKVIDAIEIGTVVYRCEECWVNHILNRSSGNGHSPQYQSHKATHWLGRQMERMLPGHHFKMTFMVHEELRDFIRSNQRICYAAFFAASSEAMKSSASTLGMCGEEATCRASSRPAHLGAPAPAPSPHSLRRPRRSNLMADGCWRRRGEACQRNHQGGVAKAWNENS